MEIIELTDRTDIVIVDDTVCGSFLITRHNNRNLIWASYKYADEYMLYDFLAKNYGYPYKAFHINPLSLHHNAISIDEMTQRIQKIKGFKNVNADNKRKVLSSLNRKMIELINSNHYFRKLKAAI